MQTEDNQDYKIDITNYTRLVKKHWHWFIISPVLCCFIAGFYLLITPKNYERTAKIIVKEDSKKSAGELDEMTILNEINFFFQGTNINNEVEVLQSQNIMQEVVKRLCLDISYTKRFGLKKHELYNESPIVVVFPDIEKNYKEFSLQVKFLSENKIKIKVLKTGSSTLRFAPITANFYDTIATPLGKMLVVPTEFFNNSFINKSIYVAKSDTRCVTDLLIKKLEIKTNDKTSIIRISITDNSIARAEDILNTLIDVYDEERMAYKNRIVANTSDFINKRLKIIKDDLEEADKNISKYKSSNMIADMRTSTELSLRESSDYNKQIFELQNQLSIAGFIKDYLTNPANRNSLIPSNSGIEHTALEKQISEYNTLMLKKFRLLENSSEKSPAVVEVANSLTEMKQSIIHSVDNLIRTLNLQISGTKNREIVANQKIADVPEREMDITSQERLLRTQEKLYLYFLQKREENELGGAMTMTNYKIVDTAGGSYIPISPKKYTILLIALIIGFLIPIGIIYLKEMFNTTIKQAKDITNGLNIPFLGVIPQANNGKNILKIRKKELEKETSIVIKNGSQNAVNEAFRIVRTNINTIAKEDNAKTIMLTSFNERAGKSFVALNLAVSFGLAKKKTILIDLNLRNATLSSWVNASKTGISDYLDNETLTLEQIIVKKSDLDFIPVGTLPDNPVELLENKGRLKTLIAELRKMYDYIIIDTTAFDAVADANIVEKVSDMTLFVARERMSDCNKLSDLETIYKNNKFSNMMIVLNGVH